MTTLQSLDHNPSITFSGAGIPSASIVGAALNDVYLNTTSGESFVCTDATFGAQQWLGDQGNKNAPITSFDHPDLVAAYTMDNISGATLVDESPNGYDGTIISASAVTGQIGNALNFDGVDDVVNLPLAALKGPKAFSGIARCDGVTANFIINVGYPAGSALWTVMLLATGEFLIDSNDGTTQIQFKTTSTYANNTYHHFVVQDEGATTGIYINNVKATLTNIVNADTGRFADEPATLNTASLGAAVRSSTVYRKGDIDQIRAFDRILTTDEISDLYNGGTGA